MRQNVHAFVGAALRALKAGGLSGPLRVVEVGSYVVPSTTDPEGQLALRPLVEEVFPGSRYVGVDARPGPGVDIVADAETLELDNPADVVICVDTLEHVRRPWRALQAMHGLLKDDGHLIFGVPFTFQIHEHPHDYFRFTPDGMRSLIVDAGFSNWKIYADPEDSGFPHAVCGLARKGLIEGTTAGDLDAAPWRHGVNQVMAVPSRPSLLLSFDTCDQANAALANLVERGLTDAKQETLEERYKRLCETPSDINEHLPTLRQLVGGLELANVVEFGTRGAVSTTALVAGLSDHPCADEARLTIVDVDHKAVANAIGVLGASCCMTGVAASTLDIGQIDECVMLFIDTLHTYAQLSAELLHHAGAVRQLIVLHDTETFGVIGEDGSTPGLLRAIDEFTERERCWRVKHHYVNNNGLTVLERVR